MDPTRRSRGTSETSCILQGRARQASGPRSATSYSRTRNDIQYVEHVEGGGAEIYEAVCKLGLERIISKRVDAPYGSGRARSRLKIKNPHVPAATRAVNGTSELLSNSG